MCGRLPWTTPLLNISSGHAHIRLPMFGSGNMVRTTTFRTSSATQSLKQKHMHEGGGMWKGVDDRVHTAQRIRDKAAFVGYRTLFLSNAFSSA